jgi:hypothetical protein
MATATLTAGQVMDGSASVLGDTQKTLYTYVKQLPYLKIALQELQEMFELNDVPTTQTLSTVLAINSGVSAISFVTNPALPSDLIEPIKLWERQRNVDPFIPMGKANSLPIYISSSTISQLSRWIWEDNQIKFIAANQNNDIKIEYVKDLFTSILDENSTISVINAKTFLEYRNAGLCAEFIAEDKERAGSLNNMAGLGVDRALGISAKGRQSVMIRRRPFRQSYKRR